MREFKDVLTDLRKSRKLTQDRLSQALGITKQALSHYERGARYPKRETLEAIADYFNVDMDFLTGRSMVTTSISPSPAAASALSPDEQDLLEQYRSLSDEGKGLLSSRADELIRLGYTVEEECKKGENVSA